MSYAMMYDMRDDNIIKRYLSGRETTEAIAASYGLSTRHVQRIVKKAGVVRTLAEGNRNAAPLRNYHTLPEELKKRRKHLSRKQRYEVLSKQPWCTLCGKRASDGIRLEVDHIDEDATNGDPSNLQVLCQLCNGGKGLASRSPRPNSGN
jgi:5-methylcytosine-specific restriction endonuclease McrA